MNSEKKTKNGPVEYTAVVYYEDFGESETVHGVTFAKNYLEAMKKLEYYYGDSIVEITLSECEEMDVYEFEHNLNGHNKGLIHEGEFKWIK